MSGNARRTLFWKVAAYYGVCLALMIAAALTLPEWLKYLPLGGLDILRSETGIPNDGNLMSQVLDSSRPAFDDWMNLLSALTGTLIVMTPLRWVYMAESLKKSWSREVAASLLLLPLVVTTIVYIVKYSLPLAFALTGIFAGVRYRTTLKSQADAFFTFACIGVGLAAGTRSLGIALVLAIFFSFTMLAAPPGLDE